MSENFGDTSGTIIGWLLAALASAWGWIMGVGIMGRVEKSERRIESLERHEECHRLADEARADKDGLQVTIATTQERLDVFATEIRTSIDATRRELKADLHMIADLIRKQS